MSAPTRERGLRTRSGNAMLRTRAAILDAAEACVEQRGVKRTTMSEIAATGGVAKATLYNHFRTKDDVLAALLEARVEQLAAACAGRSAGEALEHAAAVLRDSTALRRVREDEPALLVSLAAPGEASAWIAARAAVTELVGPQSAELILRWLVSQLLWPAQPGAAAALGGSAAPDPGRPTGGAGLGWPG